MSRYFDLAVVVICALHTGSEVIEVIGKDAQVLELLVGHEGGQTLCEELKDDVGLAVGADVVADEVAYLIRCDAVNDAVFDAYKVVARRVFVAVA